MRQGERLISHKFPQRIRRDRKSKLKLRLSVVLLACIAIFAGRSFAQMPSKKPTPKEGAQAAPDLQALPVAGAAPTGEVDIPELFAGFMDPFEYDSRGRRDPFAQPIEDKPVEQGLVHGPLLPLQRFDVSQLRLVGILWDVRQPKAMLKDPEGHLHVIGPNAKVGPRNGYVAVIREGEIVVVESVEQDGRFISTAQVVKIAK